MVLSTHDNLFSDKIRWKILELAFSQKRSQCILGSFGGTKYLVTDVKYVKE
jgi:hypothetical protein